MTAYVCVCVRVRARAGCKGCRKNRELSARFARASPRSPSRHAFGFEGKKLLFPRAERAEGKVLVPRTRSLGFVGHLARSRRVTCQLLINISLIAIEIPPRLPPPSAIIRYPPVNNLYTGVSDVFCCPAFIIAPIGNNSMILC